MAYLVTNGLIFAGLMGVSVCLSAWFFRRGNFWYAGLAAVCSNVLWVSGTLMLMPVLGLAEVMGVLVLAVASLLWSVWYVAQFMRN